MFTIKKMNRTVIGFLLALSLFPGTALALPPAVSEVRPDPPPKNKQIIMLAVDGLQAGSLSTGKTPNICGLGMSGVWAERVISMPPDSFEARLYSALSGTDPGDHGFTGSGAGPRQPTIMALMEKKGIKSAVIDGTGSLEKISGEATHSRLGPFGGDGEVVSAALEVIRDKKPFFTLVVLDGPGRQLARHGAGSKAYHEAVTAADTEVGRMIRQLHVDGIFQDSMLVVTGTTGKPPIIIKGSDFATGMKIPPVCLKDLAPTLGYLYGINMPEAKGLIIWNALRPAADRTENYMLLQRVRELSGAYADIVDAAARLENEKILVQEEKTRLARDKQFVEDEIETLEKEIGRLKLTISALKLAGLAGIIIFAAAMVVEYRILKKRYLIFT